VRTFLNGAQQVAGAIENFDAAVKQATFPSVEESY
jgi:ketopantoate hydroxymethyltransferase